MRPPILALAASLIAAPLAAAFAAEETASITPDEAALACLARATHEIEAETGGAAEPVEPIETTTLGDRGHRVEGRFRARIDGEPRVLLVTCDVSSEGVEAFSMETQPKE